MKLFLRLFLPFVLVLGLVGILVIPLSNRLTEAWFRRDLDIRVRLISTVVGDPLVALSERPAPSDRARDLAVREYLQKLSQDERIHGAVFCSNVTGHEIRTPSFPAGIRCPGRVEKEIRFEVQELPWGTVHLGFIPIPSAQGTYGTLVVAHDMQFAAARSRRVQSYLLYFFIGTGVVVALFSALILRLTHRTWYENMRSLIQAATRGPRFSLRTALGANSPSKELISLRKDLNALIRELEHDKGERDESQLSWSPATLKTLLHQELAGDEVLIVSNREPYIHNFDPEGNIRVQVPASGLVTALEPIMRACSGTWIAHGSGSADKKAVDAQDRVRVPPEKPRYQIRRIWLTEEEEKGYYYGFSNEGLWPLCHIAHTRPIFRSEDFEEYRRVNQRFADAVVQEAKTKNPVVLVQDYHFALLPRMIRERLPDATIITFWHIPWPNSEAFGICPWKEEILDGLLGSSIIGFHTRFHGNNFLDSIDRFMETRISRDDQVVSYGGILTAVRTYPISIEWPSRWMENPKPIPELREAIRARHGLPRDCRVGIGVDRMDYTKGILERFRAIERLLELRPEWIGKVCFIQIAAPSRSSIPHYRHFAEELDALRERINEKYTKNGVAPIILIAEHHTPEQVFEYFRASDFCFVSSLHDGMNLVAKEFVASRDDNDGVLILSEFAGASRELPEALIVNPYDADQCASAVHAALSMPAPEKEARMKSMRALISEFNVYRWAGRMLIDAARMRRRSAILNPKKTKGPFVLANA